MKKIILHIFAVCVCFGAFAQTSIISVNVIPSSATTSSNVQAIVTASLPGGPCAVFPTLSDTTHSSGTIDFDVFYCFESASGGCTSVDTFDVGQLPAGTYRVRFTMWAANTPSLCSSGLNSPSTKDIKWADFTVIQDPTGVQNIAPISVIVTPNPVTDHVYFTFENNNNAEISLHDISGKTVRTNVFKQGETMSFNMTDLPANIYFYTVKTGTHTVTGKVLVE